VVDSGTNPGEKIGFNSSSGDSVNSILVSVLVTRSISILISFTTKGSLESTSV